MSNLEFNILDELYFVTPYLALQKKTMLESNLLKQTLLALIKKEFVNYFISADGIQNPELDILNQIEGLYFLASKKGLFAHNSL